MKFISIATLFIAAYLVVSITTFVVAQKLSGRDIWDDPLFWRYVPEGLRQMVRAKGAINFGTVKTESVGGGSRQRQSSLNPRISRRFPAYGTPEFLQRCHWTFAPAQHGTKCTFFIRPKKGEKEMMALWVSQIVEGYILSRQVGCRLLFDYGPDVDIHQVINPAPDLSTRHEDQLHNWTVPEDFSCTRDSRCFTLPLSFTESMPGRRPLASVPFYRFALWGTGGRKAFYNNMLRDLWETLPGFEIESGMACCLGKLFHLSPAASQFEPRLFSEILPKLHDENSLVVTLYIQTALTEKNNNATEMAQRSVDDATLLINEALSFEMKCLVGGTQRKGDIHKIVWMMVTDSQHLKQWAADTYGGKDSNAKIPVDKRRWPSREIYREILFTDFQESHTWATQNPPTVQFAEAFLSWYLIGESDLAVTGENNWGRIGAIRTACPPYNNGSAILRLFDRAVGTAKKKVGRQITVHAVAGGGQIRIK